MIGLRPTEDRPCFQAQLCRKFQLLIKTKTLKNKDFSCLLINVILTFISMINFMLSCVEHGKKFYNLGARYSCDPAHINPCQFAEYFNLLHSSPISIMLNCSILVVSMYMYFQAGKQREP